MLVPVLLFALGLVLLIKGGDWFVDGACGIAHRFHISEILIGATIVSIGTTLPEVMVSSASAVTGHGEIAYGNAIGSVICNTSLIAALTIAVRPSRVNSKTLRTPALFFVVATVVYALSAYCFGTFTRITGIILLALYVIYMITTILQFRKSDPSEAPSEEPSEEAPSKVRPLWLEIVLLVIGAAFIAEGANLLVDNGTIIAEKMGVPESVIALTFVALGTSLPELVTAVTALIKGHSALSLGNILGANLFNLVLVSGLSVVLSPFSVPSEKLLFGMNASLVLDIPLMVAVMAIMLVPALTKGKLYRWQGILLLLLYAGFCTFQFVS